MPVLIVLFVIVALGGLTGIMGIFGIQINIPGAVSILPGLVISTLWVCAVNHVSLGGVRSVALDKNTLSLILLILAILVFKGVMTESKAVVLMRNELMAYRIPIALIIIIIPFLSGFVLGMAIGFVGVSFPLIIPMFPVDSALHYMSFAALAFAFGFMGMMLSPVHLCLLVTKDYFKARLLKSYTRLILPVLSVMLGSVFLFFLLRAIGIPLNMLTVVFAIGRLPGWISQWKESIDDPNWRIHRPRQIYIGLKKKDYVPIKERRKTAGGPS